VALPLHATATLAFQLRQLPDHRFKFTCEDLPAFPDAGYRYHLPGPYAGPFSARIALRDKLPFPVHSKVILTRDGVVLSFVPSFHSVQPCELL